RTPGPVADRQSACIFSFPPIRAIAFGNPVPCNDSRYRSLIIRASSLVLTARGARAPTVAFFVHAEDGIRVDLVTGVQTCALPICHHSLRARVVATRDHASRPTRELRERLLQRRDAAVVALEVVGLDVVHHRHGRRQREERAIDRKSTRLNSSHQIISYAVFGLKKT